MTAFAPRGVLRDRLRSIEIVESSSGERTILPTTGAMLGLQFRGRVRLGDTLLSEAGVTGIQSGARQYGYAENTASILVRFTAQGATCLGVPAAELAGQSIALDTILSPARVREVRGRLFDV